MRHIESLGFHNLQFIQDDALFKFGTDAVLLADFCPETEGPVCDLGCGTGIITLLLTDRFPKAAVFGVEILPEAAALAVENIRVNSLTQRAVIRCGDFRAPDLGLTPASFGLVVCNPPYMKTGTGAESAKKAQQAARSEKFCTLADVCAAAERLLCCGGSFCMVYRPERLVDMMHEMRAHRLEPKRLRTVHPRYNSSPCLILAEGRKDGAPGLSLLPPLILTGESGAETPEVKKIYHRNGESL